MAQIDTDVIAAGFASAERMAFLLEGDHGNVLALAALRFAARKVAREIAREHPRFNRGEFEAACFPLDSAAKAARLKAKFAEAAS
jgi:hypothetical protein